jgi:hypothetical protein
MYSFSGFAGETVSLTATTGPGVALLLTDEDGEPLARTAAGTEDERASLELPAVTLPGDGRYYVMVFVYSDSFSDGAFDLSLEAEAAPETTETVVQPGQIVTTSGMQVTLTWESTADLNLQVRDPLGGTLYWDSRTADNGGTFGFDANGLCEVLTSTPSEVASWPGGAQPGLRNPGVLPPVVLERGAVVIHSRCRGRWRVAPTHSGHAALCQRI